MNTPHALAETVGAVLVVEPICNRQRYFAECIESLLAQTVARLEIIVVDDDSEDDTPAVLQRCGPAITVLRKENGGKPRAVNLGVAQARADWVWFLDDDVATPDSVQSRLRESAATLEAGFVYSPHWLGVDRPNGRIVRTRLNQPWQPTRPTPSSTR